MPHIAYLRRFKIFLHAKISIDRDPFVVFCFGNGCSAAGSEAVVGFGDCGGPDDIGVPVYILGPVFPHDMWKVYMTDLDNIRSSVFGNTFTLDFGTAVVDGYSFGQRETTDFLTINCASTDYVGHKYGPNSLEVEDVYLRLVFMGWGVRHGASYRTVHMSDIAPTVAALLHVQMPNGNIGEVIGEIMLKTGID